MSKSRLFRRRFTKKGAAPGTLEIAHDAIKPRIHVISFNATELDERSIESWEEVEDWLRPDRIVWIDVQGLGDVSVIQGLGDLFKLHPLALADVVNTGQRPKTEDYGNTFFCVMRMAVPEQKNEARWEQFSLFTGNGFVLTFQERHGDCLDAIRQRLRQGRRMIRSQSNDYLTAAIIDELVDGYFPVLEVYGERLEELETQVIGNPSQQILGDIYHSKRELMQFRRAAWPLRDTLNQLLRDRHPLFKEETLPYLRDVVDHLMQVVDVIETYRELAGSFIDIYLSSISNRTNEVMRVLTVLASIFIPLTFLAGIYGMNFNTEKPLNMPELDWAYGYIGFWIVSALIALTLLFMFYRFGWLSGVPTEKKKKDTDNRRP
ncbi:MAG: magnesium/cobalt transporter CorA [Verrucomicrobia bacterium]|nr:magnesium/cobalt transporter CorA [Verrucomicrobiota bacterium]